MKYIAILDTDDFKDFSFFEDAEGKYLVVKDANSKSNEWIPLHFEAVDSRRIEMLDEDAISREDVLQALCRAVHKNDDTIPCRNQIVSCLWNKTKVQDYAEEILKLPPVMPKIWQWIPVSEDLPKTESDRCLCRDKDGYITIGHILKGSLDWVFDDPEIDIYVIEWMPLPEPYLEVR